MHSTSRKEEEALAWIMKVGDAEFSDWDALADWLAADEEHAILFGEIRERDVALADALVAQVASAEASPPVSVDDAHPRILPRPDVAELPSPANDAGPRLRWRWAAASAAVAAALVVGMTGLLPKHSPGSHFELVTAEAGSPRDVVLAGGSRVALNGGTRLRVSSDGRHVDVEAGEARFVVAHDAAHPFVVRVKDTLITDVGTRFDVVRRDGGLSVAVAEGSVSVGIGSADPIMLTAGKALNAEGTTVRIGTILPADVGSWRDGWLKYDNASLGQVATDLERVTGHVIQVSPALADRRFTGTLFLRGDERQLRSHIQTLFDVDISTKAGAWLLSPSLHASS